MFIEFEYIKTIFHEHLNVNSNMVRQQKGQMH